MILLDSLVRVSERHPYKTLQGTEGVVKQVIDNMVLVRYDVKQTAWDAERNEVLAGTEWFFNAKYLEEIEIPKDSYTERLELKVQELEDDLVIARSVLEVSEELRELQEGTMRKLIEEIDKLRKDLYDLRGY